jgi:hypothetical protein
MLIAMTDDRSEPKQGSCGPCGVTFSIVFQPIVMVVGLSKHSSSTAVGKIDIFCDYHSLSQSVSLWVVGNYRQVFNLGEKFLECHFKPCPFQYFIKNNIEEKWSIIHINLPFSH